MGSNPPQALKNRVDKKLFDSKLSSRLIGASIAHPQSLFSPSCGSRFCSRRGWFLLSSIVAPEVNEVRDVEADDGLRGSGGRRLRSEGRQGQDRSGVRIPIKTV